MDLLNVNLREQTFIDRKKDIEDKVAGRFIVDCFKTSIWDETLYGAWSKIVSFLLPNIEECKQKLQTFCETLNADEVILFERSTFLVIAHHDAKNHTDVHRFEKISNIIKQFKLSCIKTNYKFDSMIVKNEKFSAYVEGFTNSTYIMVVTSDESIQYEAISMNIKASRGCFMHLLKSSYKSKA